MKRSYVKSGKFAKKNKVLRKSHMMKVGRKNNIPVAKNANVHTCPYCESLIKVQL